MSSSRRFSADLMNDENDELWDYKNVSTKPALEVLLLNVDALTK